MFHRTMAFFDSLSNGEITLLAAVVSAAISGAVSIFTTRYLIKHGPNYQEQIRTVNETVDGINENLDSLHETIGSLARTQEQILKQQEDRDSRAEARFEAQERKAEAARWKPIVHISSVVEGNQQVNKLVLKSVRSFCLLEVNLISSSGAKMFDYPMSKPIGCSTGFGVPITHESLNLIANSSQSFFSTASSTRNYDIACRSKPVITPTMRMKFLFARNKSSLPTPVSISSADRVLDWSAKLQNPPECW